MSFFTQVVLSMAVIFNLVTTAHLRSMAHTQITQQCGSSGWRMGESRRRTTAEDHCSSRMGFSHGPDHVLRRRLNVLTNHDRNSTLSTCRKEMNPGIAPIILGQDVHVVGE